MRRRSGRALGDDTVAWYANDGSQSSTERTITTLADGPTDPLAAWRDCPPGKTLRGVYGELAALAGQEALTPGEWGAAGEA